MDRVTTTKCEDDCQMTWEGVQDVTVSRFLIQGFHPTTMGSGGWPRPPARQRTRVWYMYGVWFDSGERQIKPRESAHLWGYVRNLVYNWSVIPTTDGEESEGIGLNYSDDAQDENDLGYVAGACFIAGPDPKLKNRGCVVGNHQFCELPGDCTAQGKPQGTDCCNPKMKKTRWHFEANEGAIGDCSANPAGYVAAPPPFPLDKARPWSRVLAEVGVVKRHADEQAKLDEIAALVPTKCVVKP
jgi:hypothetical protein